jgi:hypothetical protein
MLSIAKTIVARDGERCVNWDGSVTPLYNHLQYCDLCFKLRSDSTDYLAGYLNVPTSK